MSCNKVDPIEDVELPDLALPQAEPDLDAELDFKRMLDVLLIDDGGEG